MRLDTGPEQNNGLDLTPLIDVVFLLLVFFWPIAGKWRGLLVAYALAMAGTLVYTADHFVFDILLGWSYVVVAVLAFAVLRRRHQHVLASTARHSDA